MPLQVNEELTQQMANLVSKYNVSVDDFTAFFDQPPDLLREFSMLAYKVLKANGYVTAAPGKRSKRKSIDDLYRLTSMLILSLYYLSEKVKEEQEESLEAPPPE